MFDSFSNSNADFVSTICSLPFPLVFTLNVETLQKFPEFSEEWEQIWHWRLHNHKSGKRRGASNQEDGRRTVKKRMPQGKGKDREPPLLRRRNLKAPKLKSNLPQTGKLKPPDLWCNFPKGRRKRSKSPNFPRSAVSRASKDTLAREEHIAALHPTSASRLHWSCNTLGQNIWRFQVISH